MIGILKTGDVPVDLKQRFDSYTAMVRAMLGSPDVREYDVVSGELPTDANCSGFVITGSLASAYDGSEWIARLERWIRSDTAGRPVVGICFGHQIIAQALGGRVERSPKGLAVGVQRYRVVSEMVSQRSGNSLYLPVSHYDQVVEAACGAQLILSNDFCPMAGFAYPELNMLSFQGHPEFGKPFASILVERAAERGALDEFQAASARQSLAGFDVEGRAGQVIAAFLGCLASSGGEN